MDVYRSQLCSPPNCSLVGAHVLKALPVLCCLCCGMLGAKDFVQDAQKLELGGPGPSMHASCHHGRVSFHHV